MKTSVIALISMVFVAVPTALLAGYYDAPPGKFYDALPVLGTGVPAPPPAEITQTPSSTLPALPTYTKPVPPALPSQPMAPLPLPATQATSSYATPTTLPPATSATGAPGMPGPEIYDLPTSSPATFAALGKANCFDRGSVDVITSLGYAFARDNAGALSEDGLVGGIGIETWYSEMWGIRGEAQWWESESTIFNLSGSLVYRYPIPGMKVAPYIYGGGGGLWVRKGSREAEGHVGVGVDWRFDRYQSMGITFDARRVWAEVSKGFYEFLIGLRFSF